MVTLIAMLPILIDNNMKYAKTTQFLGITFAAVMLLGFMPLGFSDLKSQLDQETPIAEIQCKNDKQVLVQRTNEKLACVYERTAEKLGWIVLETSTKTDVADSTPNTEIQHVTMKVSSDVEFVDDGREIQRSTLQKSPAPAPMFDRIVKALDESNFELNSNGIASFATTAHEKYSVNPGVGLYVEDWIPTYIPDGQKLLYSETNCYPSGICGLGLTYVPTSFVLNENVTSHDIHVSKGFFIGISHEPLPIGDIEDGIEQIQETFGSQTGNYGEGFRDYTRDGKIVSAFSGGTDLNHYQAVMSWHPDEYTSVGVHSNYHTLDELIPIFEAIGN